MIRICEWECLPAGRQANLQICELKCAVINNAFEEYGFEPMTCVAAKYIIYPDFTSLARRREDVFENALYIYIYDI